MAADHSRVAQPNGPLAQRQRTRKTRKIKGRPIGHSDSRGMAASLRSHCIALHFALSAIVAASGLQWPTDPPAEPSGRRQTRWPVCQWPADPIRLTAVTAVPELLRLATGSWLIRLDRDEPRACGCCLRSDHSASLVLLVSMFDDDRPLLQPPPLSASERKQQTNAANKVTAAGRRCRCFPPLSSAPPLRSRPSLLVAPP